MGNCIIRQNKVMQADWEISKHKEPMKAHPVLPVVLYPVAIPVIKAGSEGDNGVVRIKVVISKQELEVMLRKGGVSVGELVSHMKKERFDVIDDDDEDDRNRGRWKPVLDSIPELN
ncbi:unnamed protein product [Lactuca virosa]|uniref:Uncharacterized protein n=1 Tax=Lactuca virosa TaxID=75947 RepID=A0AAU9N289_9ASTR|nr:unnamed protein product [Lactuca virosa]